MAVQNMKNVRQFDRGGTNILQKDLDDGVCLILQYWKFSKRAEIDVFHSLNTLCWRAATILYRTFRRYFWMLQLLQSTIDVRAFTRVLINDLQSAHESWLSYDWSSFAELESFHSYSNFISIQMEFIVHCKKSIHNLVLEV